MGLQVYERDLCQCGQPISVAWHTEMDGFYDEPEQFACFACTSLAGGDKKVTYPSLVNTRTAAHGPLPPFVLGVTTTDC